MNEPICAVCGETELSKLHGFNYGVCLCDRCVEIAAHSFIHDNAERKLKETEKKERIRRCGGHVEERVRIHERIEGQDAEGRQEDGGMFRGDWESDVSESAGEIHQPYE